MNHGNSSGLGSHSIGDLEVLVGMLNTVIDSYRKVISSNDKDRIAIHSSLLYLKLLKDIGFRPETVNVGIAIQQLRLGKI